MRTSPFLIATLSALIFTSTAAAEPPAEEDELVRLPGNGEVRDAPRKGGKKPETLVPGGGLMITFDTDQDGRVTPQEVSDGAQLAFAAADTNGDSWLSALEQIAWAEQLPTRDDTLANPARFDPNLDRMVDLAEFTGVVERMAEDYSDKTSGDILIDSLKVKHPENDRGAFARLIGQRGEKEMR